MPANNASAAIPFLQFPGRDAESGKPEPAIRRSRTTWLAIFAAIALVFMTACGGGGGGGGGSAAPPPPPSDGDSGNDDDYVPPGDDPGGDDGIQPTLASIQENVFTPICTQCHAGASAPEGLRLEEGVSYGMLVNVASSEVPELLRVEPGNPADSYLIHKLEGTNDVGARMPLGGPYLSQETIDVIRQWITDGAAETAAQPSSKTALTGAWPVPDSKLGTPPAHIVLVADAELDVSLLHPRSVRVVNLDAVDPLTGQAMPLENATMQITSLAPTVIRLTVPDEAWAPGRYEVRVDGSGALAVADRAGRVIDGDADGKPGGDFVMRFDVEHAR